MSYGEKLYGVKAGYTVVSTHWEYWQAMEAAELERAEHWLSVPDGWKAHAPFVVVEELPMVGAGAIEEKRRNWQEIDGWAAGSALVDHPDWFTVFADLLERQGLSVLTAPAAFCVDAVVWDRSGENVVFAGCITRSLSDENKLRLEG